jgi:hypothetical protein
VTPDDRSVVEQATRMLEIWDMPAMGRLDALREFLGVPAGVDWRPEFRKWAVTELAALVAVIERLDG